MVNKIRLLSLLTILLLCTAAYGQNSDDARPVTQTFYIKNAFVVQQPGTVLPATSVVIRDGLIADVGKNISVPFDAKIIEADSMYVYAAFIDAASHTGIPKPEKEDRPSVKDPGNPTNVQAGITPQHLASELIEYDNSSIKSMREAGYGYAHIMPRGRMLPGRSTVITTGDGGADHMILKDDFAFFSQLKSARGVFPSTIIGVMSKYREVYKNAQLNKKHRDTYGKNPSGLFRPQQSKELAAMDKIINGAQTVFFVAPKVKDIYRVLTLKRELGFKVVLTDVKQANLTLDKVKALNTPVIVSLDLPKKIEDKKKKDDDKKKDSDKEKKKEEPKKKEAETKKEVDPAKEAFDKRKMEAYAKYESQAAELAKAGVKIGFTTLSSKPKDMKENILRMIKKGLTADQALAALTTNAADITGISNIAGTVEKGKLGNIIISDKPYFEEKSKIKFSIIDGKLYEQKEKKKSDGSAAITGLAGKWSYTVEIPGQENTGSMIITKDSDAYTLKMDDSDKPGEFMVAYDLEVDGKNITYGLDIPEQGFTMKVTADLTFDGDSFEGTITVPEFGSFPINGDKISGPK